MVTLDKELESEESFMVIRNCRGYMINSSQSQEEELRQKIDMTGITVYYDGDNKDYQITCPRFIVDGNHVCVNSALRKGCRETMCSNGQHGKCATYDKTIGVLPNTDAKLTEYSNAKYLRERLKQKTISVSFRD